MSLNLRQPSAFRCIGIGALVWLLAGSAMADVRAPVPYEAVYDVFRNGKRIAEARIILTSSKEGEYVYTHESKGKRGLARLLKAGESEQARFSWKAGFLQPLAYESTTKVAGRKQHWSAQFDYGAGMASGNNEDGPYSVELKPETHDPVTFQFALVGAIAHSAKDATFNMLDEGEIEPRAMRIIGDEMITIPLGCTLATKAERVRENSRRYTESWYAPGLDYILVRLDHGKRGDDHNSLQLRTLTVSGQAVRLDPECQ